MERSHPPPVLGEAARPAGAVVHRGQGDGRGARGHNTNLPAPAGDPEEGLHPGIPAEAAGPRAPRGFTEPGGPGVLALEGGRRRGSGGSAVDHFRRLGGAVGAGAGGGTSRRFMVRSATHGVSAAPRRGTRCVGHARGVRLVGRSAAAGDTAGRPPLFLVEPFRGRGAEASAAAVAGAAAAAAVAVEAGPALAVASPQGGSRRLRRRRILPCPPSEGAASGGSSAPSAGSSGADTDEAGGRPPSGTSSSPPPAGSDAGPLSAAPPGVASDGEQVEDGGRGPALVYRSPAMKRLAAAVRQLHRDEAAEEAAAAAAGLPPPQRSHIRPTALERLSGVVRRPSRTRRTL